MEHFEQKDLFGNPMAPSRKPDVMLEVEGRLPSWNEILRLEEWARYRLKGKLQEDFLFALRASAADSSTRITSVRSIMSTAADTLVSYQAMALARRKLRSAKKKLAAKNENTLGLKSSTSKARKKSKAPLPF